MKIGRLRKMMGYISLGRSKNADIVAWATSPGGLNFPLFPRQRLALKLIAAQRFFQRSVHWCDEHPSYDEISDLEKLINSDNTHAAVWLPPKWEFDSKRGILHAPRPPLIVVLIAGRRSGKTSIGSIALSYRLIDISERKRFPGVKLLPGQTIGALNVAADEQQAKILFERTAANLQIAGIIKGKIPASGRIRIGRRVLYENLRTSAGAVRGRTAALCVLDELAHFPGITGPASAGRIFDALLPSVRTFGPLGQIIVITSPYGRQGKLWELYEQRGKQDDLLVMQFATWEMHPFNTRD
jgi:hypothetical protein